MDAKNNIFIKKIKLIESLSIRENLRIFNLLWVSKIIIGNYDYDNSNTISLQEIYTDRIDTLNYQNLFKDNIKGLDPEELRKLIENLDFLKSLLLN